MSKKLVKTAKQQFEERLRELTLVKEWKMCDTEIYYLCEDSKAHVYLLRDQDGEYKELSYGMQYEALVFSERFLSMMSERFAENNVKVKPLFDWYASADHDDEPFNLLDIYMCVLEESHFIFEDLYKEVPDVRIITAKEQWEKDSQGAEVVQKLANGSVYKVAVTDGSITFFVHQDGGEYFREVYPSFDELRKNVGFMTAYLSHVRDTHDTDMDAALAWLQGGEYTMSKASLLDIYEVGKCIDYLCYYDEEERVDNTVDMSPVESVKAEIIKKIRTLYDMGYVVDTEKLKLTDFVGYVDGTGACLDYCDLGIYEGADGKLGIDYNGTGEWKDLKKAQLLKYDDEVGIINQVCIEHLYAILQAMVLPE